MLAVVEASPAKPRSKQIRGVHLAIGVAGLLLLFGLGLFGLWQLVKNHVFPKRFGVSVPGELFRSGQLSPYLVERTLRENNIEVVVDLQGYDPENAAQQAEIRAAEKLGIAHYRCRLKGNGTGEIAQYAYAVTAINEAVQNHRPVLVHCAAGSQRTGGVIAMYKLLVRGEDPADVYAEMRKFGWQRKPNDAMETYLNDHLPELVDELVKNGTMKKRPEKLPHMGPPY